MGLPGGVSDGLPEGITTGPDHNIWFTQRYASALVRVNGDGSVTEFPAGPLNGLYDGANPTGITAGPDGHVWFTEGGDPNYAQPGAVGYINGPDAYTYNASGTGTSSRTLSGHVNRTARRSPTATSGTGRPPPTARASRAHRRSAAAPARSR